MSFEFGKLYCVNECVEVPELYHIHTYFQEKERWNIGELISTSNFPFRNPTNPAKKERERVFESIRKENFMDYPSRYTCLFAIEYDQASHWETLLKNRSARYDLVRISLKNGKFVLLDDCFFDSETSEPLHNFAFSYWNWKGDEYYTDRHLPVFLFEGDFQVTEILKEHINNDH